MIENTQEKDRVIDLPAMYNVGSQSFQRRLAIALTNLPQPKSRRQIRVEAQLRIVGFKGKILMSNGRPYDRIHVDNVLGHESARQISMFLEMKDGKPRYQPSSLTYPRLLALYCYVAICWPHLAKRIVK